MKGNKFHIRTTQCHNYNSPSQIKTMYLIHSDFVKITNWGLVGLITYRYIVFLHIILMYIVP